MTGRPAALRAFAFASTASVADSVIADTRAEILLCVGAMLSMVALLASAALRDHAGHGRLRCLAMIGSTGEPRPRRLLDLALTRQVDRARH
jgi:hypothetical protein